MKKQELFVDNQIRRLRSITDDLGLIQHCIHDVQDLSHGYSIDDQSRALIVLSRLFPEFQDPRLAEIYLRFIEQAQRDDGFFHNFRDGRGEWFDKDGHGLEDCYGRVMWGLAEFSHSSYPKTERKKAERLFFDMMDSWQRLTYPISISLALIAFSDKYKSDGNSAVGEVVGALGEKLRGFYEEHGDKEWRWFASRMTYCNARLPQSLLIAGQSVEREDLVKLGIETLDFLIEHTFDKINGWFVAVGNNGWFVKNGEKAKFDEQSIEAGAMTEACMSAYRITDNLRYHDYALRASGWFNGWNQKRVSLIAGNGGIYDAITNTERGVNKNQGAESLVSYLMAWTSLRDVNS